MVNLDKYCSCVFQVKGKQGLGKKGRYSPYAVCSKTLGGPGAVACRFTPQVLQTYDVETLRGWLVWEGVVTRKQALELKKNDAIALIYYFLHKPPQRNVKRHTVRKRISPKSA